MTAELTAQTTEHTLATLDAAKLAAMVGTVAAELPVVCRHTLASAQLGHEVLCDAAREAQLLRALREGDAPHLRASGPHRAGDWERGWAENLREFEAAAHSTQALVPKYNRHRVLRLCGDYVQVADAGFEYAVYTALRHHYFARYFAGVSRVVEFGCGTGTSLLLLAEQLPHLHLCGLDWAESSQQILARLANRLGRPIEARRFDMFAPSDDEALGIGCGVFTSAAMEQLGSDHGPLLAFLLQKQPEICVHLEPLFELYDRSSLFDEVAARYHERRNYLRGFLPRLQELESQGRIEILELRRTGLGSFHHEGYSVVVWRPAPRGVGSRA